jgi:fibronectin-binding autotransporter adhesin
MQNGSTLRTTTTYTMNANKGIELASGTATFASNAGQSLVLPNQITGLGGLVKTGPGGFRLTGTNTFSGGSTVREGTLGIDADASLGDLSGRLLLDGGTVVASQGTTFVEINSGRSVVLANGKTSGMDATTGGVLAYAGVLGEEDGQGTAANLRIGSTERRGTVVLGGANTYRGATLVDFGTLRVNGSLAAASAVSVASGASLGGSGTIGGPTTILSGGILSPGNSPGTLQINNTLALADTSILNFELKSDDTTVGGGINDLVTGVTNLRLGGTLNIFGTDTNDFSNVDVGTSWRLFNYTGSLTLGTFSIGTTPTLAAGNSFELDTSTLGEVNLIVVPEPGQVLLAGLGVAAAGWLIRRRR